MRGRALNSRRGVGVLTSVAERVMWVKKQGGWSGCGGNGTIGGAGSAVTVQIHQIIFPTWKGGDCFDCCSRMEKRTSNYVDGRRKIFYMSLGREEEGSGT